MPTVSASAAMVPRVLSDMFWFGRYAERAEDLLRLILAARTVAIETDLETTQGDALEVLLRAVTHVSTTYPGFLPAGVEMMSELRSMLLDRHRAGTAAQSSVRCRWPRRAFAISFPRTCGLCWPTSNGRWHALAANPYDQGLQLTDASERVLSGLLALTGSSARTWSAIPAGTCSTPDAVWSGRCRSWRCCGSPSSAASTRRRLTTGDRSRACCRRVDRHFPSPLPAARAGRGLVELLVIDPVNPRSLTFQLSRCRPICGASPTRRPTARPLRLLDSMVERVRRADPVELCRVSATATAGAGGAPGGLHTQLQDLSETIRAAYQQLPPAPRPMFRSNDVGSPAGGGRVR